MKKFFYLFAATAFLFAACGDDNDNTGEGGNGGGNGNGNGGGTPAISKIEVKASDIMELPTDADGYKVVLLSNWDSKIILAESTLEDGFEIELPATLGDLESITDHWFYKFETGDISGMTFTGQNAKIGYAVFRVVDKDGEYVGSLYPATNTWDIDYYYSDSDVTLKGIYSDEDEDKVSFDVELKKGWNLVGSKEPEGDVDVEWTSQVPSGFKWYFN